MDSQPKAPLEKAPKGTVFHSFDLSAATDRLPLEVQILAKYEFGRPMGAYSSWAMLALTHHELVRVAAVRAGLTGFSDYAVLGDDIVITNDAVASEYLKIMKYLGVSINLSNL